VNIRLRHPLDRKAIRMDEEKYDLLKPAMLKDLRSAGRVTFRAMSVAVEADLRTARRAFSGPIPWHVEWIRLDLEARRIIRRAQKTIPHQYELVKSTR
jgi:hypothetical protein